MCERTMTAATDQTSAAAGERLLSVTEVAERLGVTQRTVRNWIRKGDLVAYRLGGVVRISPVDLDRFIRARRIQLP
jgi:excisionase family DNA binding protein